MVNPLSTLNVKNVYIKSNIFTLRTPKCKKFTLSVKLFYIKGSFYIKGCDTACPKLSLLSTIFVFRADPSSEMAALASNLLEHFYSAINGWILMKLDRKQSMNVCYHVCDFCADLSFMVTALFFEFLNHLCNCWMNLTKLNGEQVLNVVYQDFVFVPICELKYHPGL